MLGETSGHSRFWLVGDGKKTAAMRSAGEGEATHGRAAHAKDAEHGLAKWEGEQPRDEGGEQPEGRRLDAQHAADLDLRGRQHESQSEE